MREVKVVWFVEDEQGNRILEPKQTVLSFGDIAERDGITMEELATDHMSQVQSTLKAAHEAGETQLTEKTKSQIKDLTGKHKRFDDARLTLGIIVSRSVFKSLREWAGNQKEAASV